MYVWSLLYVFSLILTVIQTLDQGNPKYPCGLYGKACVWSRTIRSVACSSCEKWFHKDCLNMPTVFYKPQELTEVSWYSCGLPNFSINVFEDFEQTSITYSTPAHSSMNPSVDSSGSIGSPTFASSPPSRRSQTPISKRKIRILAINFQNLRSKRNSFSALLEYPEPDIVLANETWFTPSIAEREALSESYRFCFTKRLTEQQP